MIYLILNKFGDSDSKIINELMISFSKNFSVNINKLNGAKTKLVHCISNTHGSK
jgi:hypothetical protein